MVNTEENLTPFPKGQTVTEQRMGGIASGKVRRERKQFRETLEIMLKMPLKDGKIDNIEEIKSLMGLEGKNITADQLILAKVISKATKGDLKAIDYITNILGENPIQRLQISGTIKLEPEAMDLEVLIQEAQRRKAELNTYTVCPFCRGSGDDGNGKPCSHCGGLGTE